MREPSGPTGRRRFFSDIHLILGRDPRTSTHRDPRVEPEDDGNACPTDPWVTPEEDDSACPLPPHKTALRRARTTQPAAPGSDTSLTPPVSGPRRPVFSLKQWRFFQPSRFLDSSGGTVLPVIPVTGRCQILPAAPARNPLHLLAPHHRCASLRKG